MRVHRCFWCGEEIGEYVADECDDLDTCGKSECEREARAEARERRLEDEDYQGHGGDYR